MNIWRTWETIYRCHLMGSILRCLWWLRCIIYRDIGAAQQSLSNGLVSIMRITCLISMRLVRIAVRAI
jgi:hypothetical protein